MGFCSVIQEALRRHELLYPQARVYQLAAKQVSENLWVVRLRAEHFNLPLTYTINT